jgi:hypothetical protein
VSELAGGIGALALYWAVRGPGITAGQADPMAEMLLVGLIAVGWIVAGLQLPACLLLMLMVLRRTAGRPSGRERRAQRWAVVRFWQGMALLTRAGFSVLQAVEAAAPDSPFGADVRRLARGIADRDQEAVEAFRRRHAGPEAHQVATWLSDAWYDGLDPAAAEAQATALVDQLGQEDRLQAHREPLWAAAVPGFALLNVLLIILVPLGLGLWRSWLNL